jgi:pimeloyl-ACP methyl ester carboxylesterase
MEATMAAKTRLRDVVVLLPGICGSVLQKDRKSLWDMSGPAISEAALTGLEQLVLKSDDPEIDDLDDGIQATEMIRDVNFIPPVIKIDGYSGLLRMITESFQLVPGRRDDNKPANFFEFPYDWRRDNRASARKLQRFINDKLHLWRAHTNNPDAKVIFVTHSMGGLVTRYYLELLDGWRNCRLLVTFGTPFRGSLNALDSLANGVSKAFGLVNLSAFFRSCTSMYQLLPTYPAVLVEGEYRRVAETDLRKVQVDQERAAAGREFHEEIRKAVERRLQTVPADQSYALLPIVGIEQKTLQSAELHGEKVVLSKGLPAWVIDQVSNSEVLETGDGTVPRLSAIPIELSGAPGHSFVAQRHASLQNTPQLLKELRERLKQLQVKGLEAIRGIGGPPEGNPGIQLSLEDTYVKGEPVTLRARLINPIQTRGKLRGCLEPVQPPGPATEFQLIETSDEWRLELGELRSGMYRVTVSTEVGGEAAPPAVKDLFAVVS